MSGTIETLHNNILTKIEYLLKMIEYLRTKISSKKTRTKIEIINKNINDLEDQINNVYDIYCIGSVNMLGEYYLLDIDKLGKNCFLQKKNNCNQQYYSWIKRENIQTNLENIYNSVKTIMEEYIKGSDNFIQNPDNAKSTQLYKEAKVFFDYNNIAIYINEKNGDDHEKCDNCNERYIIIDQNELSCPVCGKCKELSINVIEEDDTDNQQKYGTYDPLKHCKEWIDRIQGKEIPEMAPINLAVDFLKKKFKQDKLHSDQITCKIIRKYLRKYKRPSMLNEHVPLIRKLITGIVPPQLNDAELQMIYILFIKVVKVYYIVKKPSASNVLYHPYFIFAIIKSILPPGRRQNELLMCIHLQSRNTLVKNDKILKDICEYIPELTYTPTDRNLYN